MTVRINPNAPKLLMGYLRGLALEGAAPPTPARMCDAVGLTLEELKAVMTFLNRTGQTLVHKSGDHVVIELPHEGLVLSPAYAAGPAVPERPAGRAAGVAGPTLFERLQARFGEDEDARYFGAAMGKSLSGAAA